MTQKLKNNTTHGAFRFGIVEDPEMIKETQKLRYQIYVDEFGFEKKDDHHGGLERDEYENNSIHFACLNENDAVVGTIRLVLSSEKGFPLEKPCEITLKNRPDPKFATEVSRLTVSKDLRRRKEDGFYGVESYLKKKHGGVLPNDGTIPKAMKGRKNPILLLGLCQVMYQESKRRGLTHWYMITEDKLFFALSKYGFLFEPIGEKIWYHGWRTPYIGELKRIEDNFLIKAPEILKLFLTGLEDEFKPDHIDENLLDDLIKKRETSFL